VVFCYFLLKQVDQNQENLVHFVENIRLPAPVSEVESGKKKEPELHKYEEGRLTEEAVLHSLNERNHPNSNLKYVVLGGDISLSALAKKYNLRVSDLKDYNDLKTSDLKKNQMIYLWQ